MIYLTDPFYELRVSYPHTGKHYAVTWYTHNDGNHIVLARTQKAAVDCFLCVFKRERGSIEPKRFIELDIVIPPKEFDIAYRKEVHDSEYACFESYCLGMAKAYEKKNKKLPPGWRRCNEYKPNEDYQADWNEGDKDTKAYLKDQHSGCLNCNREGLVYEHDLYQLYLEKRETIKNRGGWIYHHNDKRMVSLSSLKGPEADSRKLYFAKYAPGHHSSGMTLEEANPENTARIPVGFFCHILNLPRPVEITDVVTNYKETEKAREKRRSEEIIRDRLAREEQERKEAEEFFGKE
jgi:hypothetical protein